MNIKFIIIALVFFLVPEVSEGLLLGNFKIATSSSTTESPDCRWLEEEREIEIVSALSEDKTVESGNSCGGANAAFAKAEKDFILQHYYTPISSSIKCEVFVSKSPKYIQYCSLKLHC